jgi:conjugal transfer pilus assembly protein TraB
MSIQLKKQQQMILAAGIVIVVCLIALLAFWGNKKEKIETPDKPAFKKHNLASPISNSSNEAHWIEKTQNAWRAEQVKTKALDKNIDALKKEKDAQGLIISAQKSELSEMKRMLEELKAEVHSLQEEQAHKTQKVEAEEGLLPQESMNIDQGFVRYSAKLKPRPRIKTPENYVFSNTFAKAVVLLGADASTGVLNQSNPDVMMFQILDEGIMPNHHKSHLKNCLVSASVVGDISSERGKLRLERLSCIHEDGTTLDTQVTGIISDSKNGIRGRAVWRDGPILKNAFWGSFWQSMGNIGQQYATDTNVSVLGNVSSNIDRSRIPLAAASSGGAGAAKLYAEYNIKRAEMYHPIIQLPPETIVDVTFLKGFWLDGGTDKNEPERPSENTFIPDSESPEDKAARQFFYQNHSF